MTWEKMPVKLQERISGQVWNDGLKEKFIQMSETLLSPSTRTTCELTTIYVKFAIDDKAGSQVYAVVWIKNSKKWVVGLALPDGIEAPDLIPTPPNYKYAGLKKYFYVEPDSAVPRDLREWSLMAFQCVERNF